MKKIKVFSISVFSFQFFVLSLPKVCVDVYKAQHNPAKNSADFGANGMGACAIKDHYTGV